MESELLKQSHQIHTLAQEAQITNDVFEKFFTKHDLENLVSKLEEEKTEFLQSNQNVDNSLQLWNSGISRHITKHLIRHLVDYAIDHHRGFNLDWRFAAEDLIFNVKELVPALSIESLGEIQIEGNWTETIQLDHKKHQYPLESETKALDIIRDINPILAKQEQQFIFYDSGGDEYIFLLIHISALTSLSKLGFINP